MLETNPFSLLSEVVPTVVMQGFIIAMVLLIAIGTVSYTHLRAHET